MWLKAWTWRWQRDFSSLFSNSCFYHVVTNELLTELCRGERSVGFQLNTCELLKSYEHVAGHSRASWASLSPRWAAVWQTGEAKSADFYSRWNSRKKEKRWGIHMGNAPRERGSEQRASRGRSVGCDCVVEMVSGFEFTLHFYHHLQEMYIYGSEEFLKRSRAVKTG